MPEDDSSESDPDDGGELTDAQMWAYIFNAFGKDALREVLWNCAVGIHHEDDERRVIEVRQDKALDVTPYVEDLESNDDRVHPDHGRSPSSSDDTDTDQ